MQPDNELLRQYATVKSEEAFTELVNRHLNLVYSAALRQAGGDAHLAHDVAQSVFTDLARKAALLSNRESLSGWLYTSAYFAANKMVRAEARRREREERFMREPGPDNTPETDWEKLRPLLDTAMHGLKQSDREAILLRYFENRPYAEVGAKLGLNENAARLRIERALEKLRALLAKRAITTTAGLASIISANAIQVAPQALAANIAKASLAAGTATSLTLLKSMTLSHLKLGIGAIAVAGVATTMVLLHHKQQLQNENKSLRDRLEQFKADNVNLSNQISLGKVSSSLSDEEFKELLRLRAEVTQLRRATNQLAARPSLSAKPLRATNDSAEQEIVEVTMKTRFAMAPAMQMPEIKSGWISAGNGASVLSKEQFDQILKKIEEQHFLVNEGEVTTLNGRQANFQILDSDPTSPTNAAYGPTLDVVPHYSVDSSIFTLDLSASLFSRSGDPSHPVQALQTSNQVQLFRGQTVALERDIPPGMGWSLPALSDSPMELLVFVTPTPIDATGNALRETTRDSHAESLLDNPSTTPSSTSYSNQSPDRQ